MIEVYQDPFSCYWPHDDLPVLGYVSTRSTCAARYLPSWNSWSAIVFVTVVFVNETHIALHRPASPCKRWTSSRVTTQLPVQLLAANPSW